MRQMLIFLSFLCIFFMACNQQTPEKEAKTAVPLAEKKAPAVDEDALILRLSYDLVADPETKKQQDQNAIVNYAIDHLLDVKSTNSGLYFQILKEGAGELIKWGDRISVHYQGVFLNGEAFDSSYKKNKPIEFYVGNMIDGWNEGLQLLKKGSKALFLIPSSLAYGVEGLKSPKGRVIVPPDAVLIFRIEVL